jgi:GNAT superfamily N-acetyltransferase
MPVSASDVMLEGLHPGDAGWIVMRHAELYAADEGFDASFEPLVARIVAAYLEAHDPAVERGWIARSGDRRLGSIFCVRGPQPGVARLRLFLVEPGARRTGLGRRLLATCLRFAREAGYGRMVLSTHASHVAACALYAKTGFSCVRSEPVRSFGCDLVEQDWSRDL